MKYRSKFDAEFKKAMDSIRSNDLLVESVINPYVGKSVRTIAENVNMPIVLKGKNGKQILLENVLKMSNDQLISEGISIPMISSSIAKLIAKVNNVISAAMNKTDEACEALAEKIKENPIVKRLIKTYELEKKLKDFQKSIEAETKDGVKYITIDMKLFFDATKDLQYDESLTDEDAVKIVKEGIMDSVKAKLAKLARYVFIFLALSTLCTSCAQAGDLKSSLKQKNTPVKFVIVVKDINGGEKKYSVSSEAEFNKKMAQVKQEFGKTVPEYSGTMYNSDGDAIKQHGEKITGSELLKQMGAKNVKGSSVGPSSSANTSDYFTDAKMKSAPKGAKPGAYDGRTFNTLDDF